MVKPKEAIEILWSKGFFKECKSTKEVEEVSLKDHGTTCSNWGVILKKSKFLRRDKKGWIQKYSSKTKDSNFIFINGVEPWTDRNKKFREFIDRIDGDVIIVDPYYGIGTLHILSQFPKNKKIRFLTSQMGSDEKEESFK